MEILHPVFAAAPWGVYAVFLLAPFVQEDAAILGAAGTAMSGMVNPYVVLAAVFVGLVASDLWKYWAGRAALTHDWARRQAERPAVMALRDRVVKRLGANLLLVRFVPGTRVPFYLAAGYFRAPFAKFAAFVTLSALVYVGLVAGLSQALGRLFGAQLLHWAPLAGLAAAALVLAARRRRAMPQQG